MQAFAGRHVVVLGASGFIGRWVAHALWRHGARVTAVARDRDTTARALHATGAHAQVEAFDLTASGVEPLVARLQPDAIFNLAGYGVDRGERDAQPAERLNTRLVTVLTRAAHSLGGDWPYQRLVHTGSALEYGTTGGVLAEASPASPTTLYGRTKLAGTEALVHDATARGTRAIVARLFTVYGPGEHEGRLLPTLLAAARGGSVVPLSQGLQRRDFAYVEDVAEGLLRLALSRAAPGTVVNLATGVMQTVREFAERAADVLGIERERLQFGAVPARSEEMQHEGVSIDRLTHLTGWQPPADIASGVRRTLAHSEA
jgi:UDP-glucose 4-epimerase